jgi:hypothetical protein
VTDRIANQSPDHDQAEAHGGSSVNQIRIGDKYAALCAVLIGASIVGNVVMYMKWRDSAMETRMQEYYLLELDAKFIGAGLKKPEDSIAHQMQRR